MPLELKQRMKVISATHNVSWSAVACAAFHEAVRKFESGHRCGQPTVFERVEKLEQAVFGSGE